MLRLLLPILLAICLTPLAAGQEPCPPDITNTEGYIRPTVFPYLEHVADVQAITSSFAVKDHFLYLMEPSRLVVFDISDPSDPEYLTWRRFPANFIDREPGSNDTDLLVVGDTLVLVWYSKLALYDISNPACPQMIPSIYINPIYIGSRVTNNALVGHDDVLLAANGSGYDVIDLSNPSFPQVRHVYDLDPDIGASMRGDIAFLTDGAIVDFSNPATPVTLANIPAHSKSDVDGDLLVTGVDGDGSAVVVRFYDVSDPASPQFKAEISNIEPNTYARRLVLNGGYLYFFRTRLLSVFDVRDPENPEHVRDIPTGMPTGGAEFFGNHLLAGGLSLRVDSDPISDFNLYQTPTFVIVDLSDPVQPSLAWQYACYRHRRGFQVFRGYQFHTVGAAGYHEQGAGVLHPGTCASGPELESSLSSMIINDVRDPRNPLAATKMPGWYHDLAFVDTVLYATVQQTVRLFDASVPGELTEIACMDAPGGYGQMKKAAQRLYFQGNPAVHIPSPVPSILAYDVSVPDQPDFLFQYDIPTTQKALKVLPVADHTILVQLERGLHVVDVRDPNNPTFASEYTYLDKEGYLGLLWDVVNDGTIAYLACGEYGVRVLDFSDPYDLKVLDEFVVSGVINPTLNVILLNLIEDELFLRHTQQEFRLTALDVSSPSELKISRRMEGFFPNFYPYGSYEFEGGHIFRDTNVPLGNLSVQPGAGLNAQDGEISYTAEITGAIEGAEIFAEIVEGEDWLEVVEGEYLVESGVVTVRAEANNTTTERTGVLKIFAPEAENAPREFSIQQAGLALAEIEVAPVQLSFDTPGGVGEVAVTNLGDIAMPWSAALDPRVAWLQITAGASGEDEGAVSLTCAANPTTEPRATTLVITAPGAAGSPIEVPISQEGLLPAGLVVTPDMQTVGAAAGSLDIAIANTGDMPLNWTAQLTGGAWIRIEGAGSGVDDGSLSIAYDENTNTTQRTAVVTITGNGGELSALAVIRQAAAEDSNTEEPGDLDGDDLVNAVDIQLIINAVLEGDADPKFDVNNDGTVDAADIQLIVNAALE